MNEKLNNNKIYILAKEAGLIEFEKLTWNPELQSPTYESVAKARKFAELIVRDCIDTFLSVPPSYNDYRSQIEEAMRDYCVNVVKEHFGVEE